METNPCWVQAFNDTNPEERQHMTTKFMVEAQNELIGGFQ